MTGAAAARADLRSATVLITGASAGIGEACARRFAAEGATLVLWARRRARLAGLADDLEREHGVEVRVGEVDVRAREAVFAAAAGMQGNDGPDILVNNAGLAAGLATIQEGDPDDWDRMIDTNVKGLLYVTRALLPGMLARGRGHIINIGSTAAYQVYPRGNVYNASKFAVRALSEAMNVDLVDTPVRVSEIDPGFVDTEFGIVRFHGDEQRAREIYRGFRPLSGDDVADAVLYVAGAPPHVNVARLLLLPAAQRNTYVVRREE